MDESEEQLLRTVALENAKSILRLRQQAEEALRESQERLRRSNAELAERVAELQTATRELQDSRRAALNLMEDALQARQLAETLNAQLRTENSERRRAEEELRFRGEQFETLLNKAPLGVYLVDSDFRIREINPVARPVFGDIPDLIGRDFDEVIHILWTKEYADEIVRIYRHTLETGEPYETPERIEYRIDRAVTECYEWRIDRIPLPDRRYGVVCYFRDISQQLKARQALKELDQRKDEFLANMSHEIRSPLTAIMGYADILLSKLRDPEEIECVRTIKESGDYLVEIVNDILDLSKIEAGKLVLNIEPVSPHGVLGEIHGLMDVRARQKKLPLVLRYDGVLPETIHTDRTRLRQILVNLVSNAIKFTEKGSVQILVGYHREDGLLQIEVIDTGIGIAPEHQARLFQPFTQADSTSTREYGGTGLGLTITKRLAEMLGGSILFDSEVDRGSTFRVTIPTGTTQRTFATNHPRYPAEPATDRVLLRDRHVLVVDDRREFCYLVSRYVKDAGGRPDTALNGEAAIQAIEAAAPSDPFHAVILDIQMPGMDGYELTRKLRANGFRKPIIALTAGAMMGDREKCLQAGCDDYLTKPIDRPALVERLAYHTERLARAQLKILLVDDSHAACELMRRFLEKRGHEVRSAHDGETALPLAQEFRPDVVILDIRLPDMNGYELMRRLKETAGVSGARLIAVSGYRDVDAPRQGSLEFDHFLEKPLDMARLEALLHTIARATVDISRNSVH